jgi:hypothetical protein
MTSFLITIEWLLNSALSAFTHRTNVVELSTTRSNLLGGTSDLGSYFELTRSRLDSKGRC